MQAAYTNLIKYALKDGHTVSVWDGEEWQVKRSTSFKAIKEAVESVEEAVLRIRDTEGNIIGWASVSAFGLEPEETVVDYGVNKYMDTWNDNYNEYTSAYL
jgi:hypothetical protein